MFDSIPVVCQNTWPSANVRSERFEARWIERSQAWIVLDRETGDNVAFTNKSVPLIEKSAHIATCVADRTALKALRAASDAYHANPNTVTLERYRFAKRASEAALDSVAVSCVCGLRVQDETP